MGHPVQLMFVCLGNICRSPLAHGVFQSMVDEAGLSHLFRISSSGTGAWHVGQPPDRRMRREAARHGYHLDGIRAQQFAPRDLQTCDHILAMDRNNLRSIQSAAASPKQKSKVQLFRCHDPEGIGDVPDPYYDGRFELVFEIVERTAKSLLDDLLIRYGLGSQAGSSDERCRVN